MSPPRVAAARGSSARTRLATILRIDRFDPCAPRSSFFSSADASHSVSTIKRRGAVGQDFDALDRLGASIHERWGKLDILVANGAILGPISPITHVQPKEWDAVMATNVTSNYRLIRSMDPLLRASDAGRAIFVSSGASWKCTAYWGPYSVSKAALDALVKTYAAEVASTNVKAMMVNPGPLRTDMRARAMPGEDPLTLKTPEDLAPHFVTLAAPSWTESGKIFDFPLNKITAHQFPG